MDETVILLAGDEPEVLNQVGDVLTQNGFETRIATSNNDLFVLIDRFSPDIVIYNLDEKNSREDGFETCLKIRKRTLCPIITLSEHNDDENWIRALTTCADNYLVKPFTNEWLLAVVRASLRLWMTYKKGRKTPDGTINCRDLSINPDLHRVKMRGEVVKLTPKEFDILYYLAKNQTRAISHEELVIAVWGDDHREPRQLRSFISQIRKKIEEDPSHPEYILTIPGFGYRLNVREMVRQNRVEE
jgi:DNA-binding response OmpR family regulator